MNQNDENRFKCVNNQLCEQLCVTLHREPPKKWHVSQGARPLTRRERERLEHELNGDFL